MEEVKMTDLKKLQKEIYQNKVNKGFNLTDINLEFCSIYGEVSEAHEAWRKKQDDVGEELADVATLVDGESITDESELKKLMPLKLLECNQLEDSYVQLKYEVIK